MDLNIWQLQLCDPSAIKEGDLRFCTSWRWSASSSDFLLQSQVYQTDREWREEGKESFLTLNTSVHQR